MGSQRSLSDFFFCGSASAPTQGPPKRGRGNASQEPQRAEEGSRLVTCPICSKAIHKLVAAAHVDTHFVVEEPAAENRHPAGGADAPEGASCRPGGGDADAGEGAATGAGRDAEAPEDGDEARGSTPSPLLAFPPRRARRLPGWPP